MNACRHAVASLVNSRLLHEDLARFSETEVAGVTKAPELMASVAGPRIESIEDEVREPVVRTMAGVLRIRFLPRLDHADEFPVAPESLVGKCQDAEVGDCLRP